MSLFLIILFSCFVTSNNGAEININSAYDHNWHKNFVDLTEHDSIFIWKYEITNSDYHFFLNDLYLRDENAFNMAKYDSTMFEGKMPQFFDDPYIKNYHTHAAFADYPIINISKEAAKKYCEWLTEVYNNGAKKKFNKVYFRLPLDQEVHLLLDTIPKKRISDFAKRGRKKYVANLAYWAGPEKKGKNYPCDGGFQMVNVFMFKQHKNGIRSAIGNVAEMTDSGKVYGGSFDDLFSEINNTDKYLPPDPRIGFRVVMEVISK